MGLKEDLDKLARMMDEERPDEELDILINEAGVALFNTIAEKDGETIRLEWPFKTPFVQVGPYRFWPMAKLPIKHAVVDN